MRKIERNPGWHRPPGTGIWSITLLADSSLTRVPQTETSHASRGTKCKPVHLCVYVNAPWMDILATYTAKCFSGCTRKTLENVFLLLKFASVSQFTTEKFWPKDFLHRKCFLHRSSKRKRLCPLINFHLLRLSLVGPIASQMACRHEQTKVYLIACKYYDLCLVHTTKTLGIEIRAELGYLMINDSLVKIREWPWNSKEDFEHICGQINIFIFIQHQCFTLVI